MKDKFIFRDCSYFKYESAKENEIEGMRCNHPSKRKQFDGSFQCSGRCFIHRRDFSLSKKEYAEKMSMIENGSDSAI
jgi:hypothetical protein